MHDVNGETVVREYVSRHFHYRVEQVMEAEYYLLQALEFHTVVFHPFKPMEVRGCSCASCAYAGEDAGGLRICGEARLKGGAQPPIPPGFRQPCFYVILAMEVLPHGCT